MSNVPKRTHSYKATRTSRLLPSSTENSVPPESTPNTAETGSSSEDDRPDPSLMTRASTGSQYSNFQILPASESDSNEEENDHNLPLRIADSSAIENTVQDYTFSLERETSSNSSTSTTSSREPSIKSSKSDSMLVEPHSPRLGLPDSVPLSDPQIIRQSSLMEMKTTSGLCDGHSPRLSRIGSMSESDLYCTIDEVKSIISPSNDTCTLLEDHPTKKALYRKNAVRKKSNTSPHEVRKFRSQSQVQSVRDIGGPALPQRNPHMQLPLSRPISPLLLPKSQQEPKQRDKSIKPDRTASEPIFRKYKLHEPRNAKKLRKHLKNGNFDQVQRDRNDDTPLHAIVRAIRKDKHDLLIVLMVYSDFGTELIDMQVKDGSTALHIAVKNKDFDSVQILLTFGANINAVNNDGHTPLDVLNIVDQLSKHIWELLLSLDAESGSDVKRKGHCSGPRETINIDQILDHQKKKKSRAEPKIPSVQLANELEQNLNEKLQNYETISDTDLQMSIGLQQFELQGWKTTAASALHFEIKGRRILFLDGGGVRGLIQIEILSMLEKKTGKRVTELFDWIVGTSTGGIVALGLVYGKKSLAEIRQFYFKMKDEVFVNSGFSFGGNSNATPALEEILKETLTSNKRMSDVQVPKVLVTAVNKTTNRPQLVFFNNCLENEYSNEYIWKVARYTSAAPMYFSSLDDYVDGGILANNPSDHGLTVIQSYYQRRGIPLEIACIVSIGSGTFPAKDLGNIDVHEVLGMKMLNVQPVFQRARNLMTLLSNALVRTDDVVKNCKSRCDAQKIPFHRFSPTFRDMTVDSDETENPLLVKMLIGTKIEAISQWYEQLEELVKIFNRAEAEIRLQKLRDLKEKKQRKLTASDYSTHAFSQ